MRETLREMLAEFLGTFVLIVFGTAVVAQVVLSRQANGSYLSINLGWGLAVVMGVYVAGGVTGAHLTPAVTLTLAVRRGFPWGKVRPYWAVQFAGAFTGALITFVTYREAFDRFDGGVRQVTGAQATAGVFAPAVVLPDGVLVVGLDDKDPLARPVRLLLTSVFSSM